MAMAAAAAATAWRQQHYVYGGNAYRETGA